MQYSLLLESEQSLEDGLLSVPVPSDRNYLRYFKKLNNVIFYVAS